MISKEDRLDELFDQWEEQQEQGSPVTPEELCRDCPELLEDFRQLTSRLKALEAFLSGDSMEFNADRIPPKLDFLAGRFRPVRFHARGGLGEVFIAQDEELRREVALKRIRKRNSSHRDSRERFLLEAEITGRLEHPGIVPIYGLGKDDTGHPYYAMRLIHGQTLGEAIQEFYAKDKPRRDAVEHHLAFQKLLRSFLAVCQTVGYAHSHGIVHRDLKPDNIMLGRYDETLVVDWGLAKSIDDRDQHQVAEPAISPFRRDLKQTEAGSIKGSPAFMSPEQAEGHWTKVGPASDIYSLGVTLYVLLTGSVPFDGATLPEVLRKVKRGEFQPPRRVNHDLPLPLDAICLKAMRLKPEERYATPVELAGDIEHWLADEPVSAWREPWTVTAGRFVRRRRTLMSTLAACVLVGVAALGALSWQQQTANLTLGKKNRELLVATERANLAATQATESANEAREQKREAEEARRRAERELYFNTIALAHREFLGGNLARSYTALHDSPEALRGWEWHYLNRAHHTARLAVRLPGESCLAVAISPDGGLIAAASDSGDIHLIDARTGERRLAITDRKMGLTSRHTDAAVAFAPDGKRLAYGSGDGTVTVWDIAALVPSVKRERHLLAEQVSSLAFSPDGKRIVASDLSDNVKIWDYETDDEPFVFTGLGGTGGRNLYRFAGMNSPPAVAFNSNGTSIVSSASDEIKIWDPKTGIVNRTIKEKSRLYGLALHPDGRQCASGGDDGIIRVWNLQNDVPPTLLTGHKGRVNTVAFSPDGGRLVSGGEDRTVRVWDLAAATPREILTLRAHMGAVQSVAFTRDGKGVVSAGMTRLDEHGDPAGRYAEVKRWDVARDQLQTLVGEGNTAAFSPDGRFLVTGGQDGLWVWKSPGFDPLQPIPGIGQAITEVVFNRRGTRLAACGGERLYLFDWHDGQAKLVRSIEAERGNFGLGSQFAGITFSPDDGKLAAIALDKVYVWDVTGKEPRVIWEPNVYAKRIFFARDGLELGACGSKLPNAGALVYFDLAKKQPVRRVDGWNDCAISGDGLLLALAGGEASSVSRLQVRTTPNDRDRFTIRFYLSYLMGMAFSPDAQRLAVWGGEPHTMEPTQVRLLDANSGHEALLLQGEARMVSDVKFSEPDGGLIAFCQDGKVWIWDGRPIANPTVESAK